MRSASDLMLKLASIRVRVVVRGDRVIVTPRERLKPWMLARAKQYKQEFVALNREYEQELKDEREAIQQE